jgi:glycosyltransferase involved in cell wall biosynthesis
MKVLLLSRYDDLGASSRVRYLQYLTHFANLGWTVEVSPFLSNDYLTALYSSKSRLRYVVLAYMRRLLSMLKAGKFNVLIIEKELFPFLPAWFERILSCLKIPYVVDYDDAQFHRYDTHRYAVVRTALGHKIDSVMRNASVVIVGNEYLAKRAYQAGAKRIEIIPTVVDTSRYLPSDSKVDDLPIVGWIGTPQTSKYLKELLPVFDRLKHKIPVRFVAVGARSIDFVGTPIETISWSIDTEISSIQSFSIGIMPLPDSPWERGKCGYKLIQCMACAKPVIASPVGVNSEIVEPGINGYLARSLEEWYDHLYRLLTNIESRYLMGLNGRQKVMLRYSIQSQASRFSGTIESIINQ